MLNKVELIGRLGADPEVRTFQTGGQVCNLKIATSEKWRDKNSGETKERTEWHTVAIFQDGLIGVAEKYLRKGALVYIQGKLQTRKWQDQSGTDRYTTEIILQGFDGRMLMLGGGEKRDDHQKPAGGAPAGDELEDMIPF